MIQKILSSDIDKILSLQKDFKDGFNKNVLLSSFKNENFYVFGYYEGEKLVGEISFSYLFNQADIESVFVGEEYRKKGIASELLSFCMNFLKDKEVNEIFLEVREKNIPAISLYKKFNFEKIKIRERYYSDGENAVIMSFGKKV